ncbi:MAG TPA: hypothetical protein VNA13_01910 [Xanthomonadales bacterium]|nr:hypothetical protein [Xanthomonadales bacterium]
MSDTERPLPEFVEPGDQGYDQPNPTPIGARRLEKALARKRAEEARRAGFQDSADDQLKAESIRRMRKHDRGNSNTAGTFWPALGDPSTITPREVRRPFARPDEKTPSTNPEEPTQIYELVGKAIEPEPVSAEAIEGSRSRHPSTFQGVPKLYVVRNLGRKT